MTTWNAKIARVDQPEPGLLTLSFRSEAGNEVLVIATLPGALGLGVVGKRPRGARASPVISQLRRHLEGARIEEVAMSRRAVRLSLTRARKSHYLFAAPSKPSGAWWLCEPDGSVIVRSPGAPTTVPFETAHLRERSLEGLRACGASVVDAHLSVRRRQLERLLDGQVKRLSKKRDAIREDLERAATAEALQEQAGLILAHVSEIPPDAPYFEATTWGADPKRIRIDLDPRKSPAELAQELFKKAKRLKRGLDLAPAHLRGVEEQLAELHREREQLGSGSLDELEARLEALGVSVTAPREEARRRRQAGARLPYRKFLAADGSAVLVGRSAADNDRLTLRIARPHDLWLHARGVTGAHVIVPLTKGQSCSPETLVDAATLAAHYSDLRAETVVDVLYTPRRLVHKKKGSAVGSVTLGAEKVIALRVEPERLQRLLKSEKKVR
ncbi:MAG: NFACT RNA binding domain-containing protein [Polyangiales bacterium]